MESILIKNATIINEGRTFTGSVLIEDELIKSVYEGKNPDPLPGDITMVDAAGKLLLPGIIDDHVHFREPGLTHKGTIGSESSAAVAGGVTSFMDMPNTVPQTTTLDALNAKLETASASSHANYSFFFGVNNDNVAHLNSLPARRIPGIKLFLGSSTGNMLVNDPQALQRIFSESNLPIAVHAEKEDIIKQNTAYFSAINPALPIEMHPLIRSEEACYAATSEVVELACRTGARLHILHVSTARELRLFEDIPLTEEKLITAEATVNHLFFSDMDYPTLGARIKMNPAVKTTADREALREALRRNTLDIIATDHAPHLLSEKEGNCLTASSGAPTIQHSLLSMLELADQNVLSLEQLVRKMCHNPALLYRMDRRGYIRPGFYADLVLVSPGQACTVSRDNILHKCGWSPFENYTFHNSIFQTYVNGRLAYDRGQVTPGVYGKEIVYNRLRKLYIK